MTQESPPNTGPVVTGYCPQSPRMDDQYVFSCSECRAEFRVDRAVRRDLRRIGCLRCEAPVSETDFDPVYSSTEILPSAEPGR